MKFHELVKSQDDLPSGTAGSRGSNSDAKDQPLFTPWLSVLLVIGSSPRTDSGHQIHMFSRLLTSNSCLAIQERL